MKMTVVTPLAPSPHTLPVSLVTVSSFSRDFSLVDTTAAVKEIEEVLFPSSTLFTSIWLTLESSCGPGVNTDVDVPGDVDMSELVEFW